MVFTRKQEMIVDAMRRFVNEEGRNPKYDDWVHLARPDYAFSPTTVSHHFGTWNKAIECAGFTPGYQSGPLELAPGTTFSRLKVVRYVGMHNKKGRHLCICDCGTETIVFTHSLNNGNTKSCGCLRIDQCAEKSRIKSTHGYTTPGAMHPLYRTWVGMRNRCNNPKNRAYPNYGGRGIKVCKRWDDFTLFLEDMGKRPEGMTLDRIDNDGNYEPENCQWSTYKTQVRNRSKETLDDQIQNAIALLQDNLDHPDTKSFLK